MIPLHTGFKIDCFHHIPPTSHRCRTCCAHITASGNIEADTAENKTEPVLSTQIFVISSEHKSIQHNRAKEIESDNPPKGIYKIGKAKTGKNIIKIPNTQCDHF
jgi:hypothetical protein